jgi:hypothetical protein
MNRNRVVDCRLDPASVEMCGESIPVTGTDYIEVVYVVSIHLFRGEDQICLFQALPIGPGHVSTLIIPCIEKWQLYPQYSRLHLVQAAVDTDTLMLVLHLLAIITEYSHFFCKIVVIRDNTTTVTNCTEVLGGIETEAPRILKASHPPAMVQSTVCLAGVFDNRDLIIGGQIPDGAEIRGMPIKVDGDYYPGT